MHVIFTSCTMIVLAVFKIMRCEDSVKSSRIMHRSGKPYYEYRDTAMSSVGPFRPEWIEDVMCSRR